MKRWMLLFALVGCDDHLFPAGEAAGGGGEIGEGYCAVENLVQSQCLQCHGSDTSFGGLDLQTDPTAFITGTRADGVTPYIDPGDPSNSYWFLRLEGTDGFTPPTGGPSEEILTPVRAWIEDGASDVCE